MEELEYLKPDAKRSFHSALDTHSQPIQQPPVGHGAHDDLMQGHRDRIASNTIELKPSKMATPRNVIAPDVIHQNAQRAIQESNRLGYENSLKIQTTMKLRE